ncbi:hypothetical protein [Ectothiorhodospira shaposhnikovii]|uniref:hypothetical protein n=1 Tax=Ectothiorhodospira shaposhnikovii TaxID=1054 RepID=UPI001EE8F33F|nr:hypothetical protein [Ectothiorhodospira shaposhnikovii]MCG5512807.1 hypothetical protein [Ectothiorhodospira shaposhnikovii]
MKKTAIAAAIALALTACGSDNPPKGKVWFDPFDPDHVEIVEDFASESWMNRCPVVETVKLVMDKQKNILVHPDQTNDFLSIIRNELQNWDTSYIIGDGTDCPQAFPSFEAWQKEIDRRNQEYLNSL